MSTARVDPLEGREASERLARCVATMVYYQGTGWSWAGAQLLWEEARDLRSWAARAGVDQARLVSPLETELSDRFGPDVGAKLQREFLRALHDACEA